MSFSVSNCSIACDHEVAPKAIIYRSISNYIFLKYKKVVQYGCQGRSGLQNAQGVKDIKEVLIGDVYLAKAWYVSNRVGIGTGKKAPVPDWLNRDLFQGPAPREDYRDNVVHYNWHWFQTWGTGECGNNGVYQLEACRWTLCVDYPEKVSSYGGRCHYTDDWQFPDSQIVDYKYSNGLEFVFNLLLFILILATY